MAATSSPPFVAVQKEKSLFVVLMKFVDVVVVVLIFNGTAMEKTILS